MNFHHDTLPNGLQVIAETNESAYSVSVAFFVRTGARNETPELAGVSHFLEHMVFKGSPDRSGMDVNRQLDEMGADANAFTTEEQTVYYATLLPEVLEDAVNLLADILRPALREEDFETEKKVILEEINMYEDQPPFGADEKCRELFFAGHPLGNGVLGTQDGITALSLDQMRAYHAARYRPDNIVLAAAGRLDFDAFFQQADRVCGHWTEPAGTTEPEPGDRYRRVSGRRGVHRIVKPSATQQHTILLSDGPCCRDADRFAAMLLANMIGDDVGSRLYWELVDTGLADEAGMGAYEFFDNGFFATGLSGEPGAADEILLRTKRILASVARDGLSREELDRAKNKILTRLVLGNERPSGRLFSIGGDWTARSEYRTVRRELDDLRRLSLDDVHDLLRRYPIDDPFVLTIGPDEPDAQRSGASGER